MSSDIVLTAALRNNLLSLQSTQSLIDKTQLRLATGLKVNSALDGPANFFAAQSLDNRANDLNRLLDGISQSIRTIETANSAVTSLTTLVEQAQSIVSSARDELAGSTGVARAVGTVDLSNTATIVGVGGITAGDIIRIRTVDDAGTQITEDISIVAGDSAYTLAAKITDQFADNRDGEVTASITSEGFLEISSTGGRSFRITAAAAATDISLTGYAALGLGDIVEDEARGGVTLTGATVVAGNTISSISLYEGSGDLVEAGDAIAGATLTDANGNTVLSGFLAADSFNFVVNNGAIATGAVTLTAAPTFQDLVDAINQNTTINPYIEASFDSLTGQLRFTSLDDSVDNFQITAVTTAATTFDIGLADPSGELDEALVGVAAGTYDSVFTFNSSTAELDRLAQDYNTLREQIDSLVQDAQYRGVNLLNGDNLTTFFNEDNTSQLVTEGSVFTSNGLGLTEATFRSSSDIELSAEQSREALNSVRSFGNTLANSLSIIQTRRDFTQETINTLRAGADDLTVADQNEEGANLLALQTRQTLGVTALSLASQSQQAVLRLF